MSQRQGGCGCEGPVSQPRAGCGYEGPVSQCQAGCGCEGPSKQGEATPRAPGGTASEAREHASAWAHTRQGGGAAERNAKTGMARPQGGDEKGVGNAEVGDVEGVGRPGGGTQCSGREVCALRDSPGLARGPGPLQDHGRAGHGAVFWVTRGGGEWGEGVGRGGHERREGVGEGALDRREGIDRGGAAGDLVEECGSHTVAPGREHDVSKGGRAGGQEREEAICRCLCNDVSCDGKGKGSDDLSKRRRQIVARVAQYLEEDQFEEQRRALGAPLLGAHRLTAANLSGSLSASYPLSFDEGESSCCKNVTEGKGHSPSPGLRSAHHPPNQTGLSKPRDALNHPGIPGGDSFLPPFNTPGTLQGHHYVTLLPGGVRIPKSVPPAAHGCDEAWSWLGRKFMEIKERGSCGSESVGGPGCYSGGGVRRSGGGDRPLALHATASALEALGPNGTSGPEVVLLERLLESAHALDASDIVRSCTRAMYMLGLCWAHAWVRARVATAGGALVHHSSVMAVPVMHTIYGRRCHSASYPMACLFLRCTQFTAGGLLFVHLR